MLSRFKPTWMIKDIYSISPQFLLKNQIDTILTDLDNTLIPWNAKDGNQDLENWLKEMRKHGIKVIIVSNNGHKRIARALAPYNVDFIARAVKPLTFGLRQAIQKHHLNAKRTVMIGDQLMTDVFAANNLKIKSILVKPLVVNDAAATKLNRQLEKMVWKKLMKRYPDLEWK